MDTGFFIDEMALLKAFIDYRTLSYNELQERGVVPTLDKQEHRALFKSTVDKLKRWELIESIPDSHPKAWKVNLDKAQKEYEQLTRDIERKQLVDKYSYEYLRELVEGHEKKLRHLSLYRNLAIAASCVSLIVLITGMGIPQMIAALKHLLHSLLHHS
jgi:hypothetical protein